jgi:hypothetical protein
MKKKTVEQVAAMSARELTVYLLTLTPAERSKINNDELLKARGAAIFQQKVENLNAMQKTKPIAYANKR